MQRTYLYLSLAILISALDQLSKFMITQNLELHETVRVMPFFNLFLTYNTGAAFSFLSQAGGWQRWFLIVLPLLVSVVLIIWLRKLPPTARWTAIGLACILGGATGNLLDRLIHGYVIDFIDWYYTGSSTCLILFFPHYDASCHWPTFNIADSAITIGASLLLALGLLNLEDTSPPGQK